MARRAVIEVQCSRCERKELVEQTAPALTVTVGDTSKESRAFFAVMADGTKIEFEDLCTPCTSAVKSHLEAIGKKIEGLSPERKKKDALPEPEPKRATPEAPVAKKKAPGDTQEPSHPTASPSVSGSRATAAIRS